MITIAKRIKAAKKARDKSAEDRERADTERAARKQRREARARKASKERDKKEFLAALDAVGGAEGILKNVETGWTYRGILKISLNYCALEWIQDFDETDEQAENPLANLFKELKAQGFWPRYRNGYGWVTTGPGHYDEGEYFADVDWQQKESPYIEIKFPPEGYKREQ